MEYYAHSTDNSDKIGWQKLTDHLESVAERSSYYAKKFNAEKWGYVIGLLHDVGKFSEEFQQRLEGANIKVDHSTAGAKVAVEIYGKALGSILAYIIAGHHSGLPDYGSKADQTTLLARLKKKNIPDYSTYKAEICTLIEPRDLNIPIKPLPGYMGFSVSFLIRMLYSCLVDADFLDTESVLSLENTLKRGGYPKVENLLNKLDKYLEDICSCAPRTKINQYRTEILEECREKAKEPVQLFTLTVPTGGGKTLSSLAFALKHAKLHGLERVIYVIPYTSIIEQNANVFRKVLGIDTVLEHHSNFQYLNNDSEEYIGVMQKLRLSAENWDTPVIVTTNVQFFESLFSNRSSKCRKLHNLSKSVIILDEAQMLPVDYLKPCLAALVELTTNYGTSVVLCSATQPALTEFIPEKVKPLEITQSPEQLYQRFCRVSVKNLGECDDKKIVDMLLKYEQVLCIVNTRKHAQILYKDIKESKGTFHLSARMCPVHRTEKLNRIKETLENGNVCRVISTQLIEAGVDIDFHYVFRSLAGIDSIAQAAGRCNREGKRLSGEVFIFKSTEKHGQSKGWLSRTATVAEMILRNYSDPLSLKAVERYFEILYDIEGDGLDKKRIMNQLKEDATSLGFPFLKVANEFRIIENDMYSIIVPYDERCIKLIDEARWNSYPAGLMRQFQPYTVSIYHFEFMKLLDNRQIETINGIFHVLSDRSCYDSEVGLVIEESQYTNDDILIF
ncbi:MAG: CRISPR-associated endonuclease/helicase Cas3 [Clostridiales bacterium]|jgi:CRISPR-associated helicase Cas3/CRISPR-associated endonuclease Cas3-HD|nr:CRISPR-associated endonuclease/helicase Cas3 [Clostridiales bacterium]